jgi:AGZA family xanthine/uracil permease-like MFS transporter
MRALLLEKWFKLKEHKTNISTEVIAGITTFLTMAYIIVVNPAILEAAGIPKGPSMVATALTAFFGTFLMGIYANRPFAIAPYMGENAFIAYTVVKVLGYNWQTALGAVFIGGIMFVILTLLKLRRWLARAIPESLKYSFAVGIGLFLTFIGLHTAGIVVLGSPGAPVAIGDLTRPGVLVAFSGFLTIIILMVKRVKGSILIGILFATFLSFFLNITAAPKSWFGLPPSLEPILFKLDIMASLNWGFFAVILTIFIMDFVDTMGTLIGVSARANFLDEQGNLPQIERPMLADALSTVLGALLGTTTAGTYIESASGVEEGGRTGLTAVITALLFLAGLFLFPFVSCIPPCAYGPALIVVGMLMIQPITKIDFSDYTELVPAFCVIILMSFTYNIGVGITGGFVIYPLLKLISGRLKDVSAGLWCLSILSWLFFIFYPYGH